MEDERERLVSSLEADLVGPFAPSGEEVLPLPPSRWYLTGSLSPAAGREVEDPTAEEGFAAGPDTSEEESAGAEPEPKQRHRFPASLGLSVLLPAGSASDEITATVSYAEYLAETLKEDEGKKGRTVWRRFRREPSSVRRALDPARIAKGVSLPGTRGVHLRGKLGAAEGHGLPPGTRALSLFVVNERAAGERGRQDEQFLFQVSLTLSYDGGFVPRSNRRDESSSDWDERISDLHFRNRFEYAVGHGVSVEVPEQDAPVRSVRTTWLPRSEVRRVVTREAEDVVTEMEALSSIEDPEALREALSPLATAYGSWIESQRKAGVGAPSRREVRDLLMDRADEARRRIEEGLDVLAKDAAALRAFRIANRAMALAARRRSPERYEGGDRPSWRLFQIAFLLMNVPSILDPRHRDRDNVELIFFPTGGGKTEAYLGVIAFALVLRRLRGRDRPDGGLGVAVLLRYTLRLLTLDQLGRAASLICALEEIRRESAGSLGDVRFSVGLWVGQSATSNTISEVSRLVTEYKNSSSKNAASPFPLADCPWCGRPLTRDSLTVNAETEEVVVGCVNFQCEFSAAKNRDGLPVVFVDEQVYRELPSFLVATVDKFAMLPWRGETGMLFGRVLSRDGRRFYRPLDRSPKTAERLPEGLIPPELVVQDELHLISGPLGTMAGLYETAIEALCLHENHRPKVIASTATVRRAKEQVRSLFGRNLLSIFPPPGVEDSETFFAGIDRDSAVSISGSRPLGAR